MTKKKLIALILCVVTIVSLCMPAMIASAVPSLSVYHNGSSVAEVAFPSNQTAQISVETADGCESYQWQILVPGSSVWANIYNENSASLLLSQAMIENMLNGQNTAYVRCQQIVDGSAVYTDSIAVSTTEAVYTEVQQPAYVPAPAPINEAEQPVVEEVLDEGVEGGEGIEGIEGGETPMLFAMAPRSLNTYTIRIDYVFEDGSLAAQSWEGTFTEGTSYNLSVTSPHVNGYVTTTEKIEETFDYITENKTYTVTYTPTTVKYVVKHFQQNISDDGYTEVVADRKEHNDKFANDQVGTGHSTTYEGFKTMDYDATTAIAADSSTELNIYYDRLYYLMSFNLDGGYGVEPIYARYGTSISVGTPSKAGYSFNGWNGTIPATMPASNSSFTASWTAGSSVNVNVVFWYENANDANYTFVGSTKTNVAYTEGKTVKSSDFKDLSFTGRDNLHFTFNSAKSETVTLKADGSTIVNVYFTRNTYRMIFFNCYICAKNEDSKRCYPSNYTTAKTFINNKVTADCVNKYYNDGSTGIGHEWNISVYTRKWQQNVRPDWAKGIAGRSSTRRWMPYEVTGANGKLIYNGKLNVSTMNVMPDADVIFYFLTEGSAECTMNYWITPVPGATISGDPKTVDGVEYVLKDKVVTMMGGITENEEYVDIEGFTKVYTWSQLADKGYRKNGDDWCTAHFFYKRNDYKLAYISDGETVKTVNVPYEALIKGDSNQNFKPDYPSDWEPGAYEFAGWYLDENCTTAVNWSTQKMPVGGFSVYAKWAPVVHTIKIKDYANGGTSKSYKVEHGKPLSDPPADPTKDGYEFIAWFYVDEQGVEKPFTFEMPITRDIDLYPKWKQVAIVNGTISYKLEDGTAIAADSAVQALVGETKTYEPKTNNQLYSDYQEYYFPTEVSHSITFEMDESANVYSFVYVRKDSVPYTVKYLEEGTNEVLAEDKVVSSTKAAVVENFLPIAGYLPDLYKKTLLLDADGNNELIFWYTKDSEHAPVLRGHYLENADDAEYTTYQELIDGYGKIGETFSEAPLTDFVGFDYDGFTLNESKSTLSGVLTADGLELKLYYDRNLYPYEFRFEDENGKVLKTSVTGTAKFEATVSYEAPDIPGYELISDSTEEIDIQIEEGSTAVKNVKTFTYKAALADLKITKSGADTTKDPDQTFLFRIMGTPTDSALDAVDMTVTIRGNDDVTILDLPVGEYTIQEVESWSWRYSAGGASYDITLDNPEEVTNVTFANTRNNGSWLSGDSYVKNLWQSVISVVN